MSRAPTNLADIDPLIPQLRTRRLQLRMSQRQLADLLDVDPSMISVWENGYLDIRLSSLRRWADALGMRPDLIRGRRG